MNPRVSVVYLCYVPFGPALLRRFLESYIKHEAGLEHDLVVLFNGIERKSDLEPFYEVLNATNLASQAINCDELFDISSYFYAAETLESDYLLFLNTYSIVLADNWLQFYYSAISQSGVGIVGATGSGWRSPYNQFKMESEESAFSSFYNFKAALSKRIHFSTFKGPYLRTNAFFISRKLFLSLKYHDLYFRFLVPNFRTESKLKTLYFEHGNRNLTYQIRDLGLKPLIVDRYGRVYESDDWVNSKTLWISNQENLLIHDNQTLKYENGCEEERRQLTYWAWGIDSK